MNEQEHTHKKLDAKITILLGLLVLLAVALITGLLLVNRTQDIRERASGPSCPINGATCEWDPVTGAKDYTIQVEHKVGDGWLPIQFNRTGGTAVQFTSEANETYRCVVTAVMEDPTCSATGSAQATCTATVQTVTSPAPSATSTPPVAVTATGTPGVTATGTITVTSTLTGTPAVTSTGTPAVSRTGTPKLTTTTTLTSGTPTAPTATRTANSSQSGGATATPTTYFIGGSGGTTVTATTSPLTSSTPTSSSSLTSAASVTSSAATPASSHTPTLPTTGIPNASIMLLIVGLSIITFGLLF